MKSIAVIGAGISGLSSAYELSNAGYSVTIIAEAFSPNTTSNKAAAFWFPYHIRDDKRGITWCRESYRYYEALASNEATGISMHRLIKMIDKNVAEPDVSWIEFMPKGEYRLLEATELPEPYAIGYEVKVPLIETQIFLPWLMNELKQQTVVFLQKVITSFQELDNYDFIINCAGLGARVLCNDELVYPARGQVALISPQPGLPIFIDNEPPLYLVPRADATILGGTMEEHVWEEKVEEETLAEIHRKIASVFPTIKDEKIIGSWAGIRPCRMELRLENENNIIHNYGHGGSGFTLAWGCAREVLSLVKRF